jgi:hypothetical protein
MDDELRLKVFISKSEQGRPVWQPLVAAIEALYKCKIIWEQSEATNYPHPETLMEEMVKRSDVAIFLLTHETEGVFRELRLWHKHKAGNFSNALILRDHSFRRDTVKLKSGFEVVDIAFDAKNPSIPDVFPAINKLLKEGSQSAKFPSWVRQHNKLVSKYNWVVARSKVPVNRILALFKKIASNPRYKDPEEWSFRINWSTAAPDLDSYSNGTTCLTLFEALLQTDATQLEYELIFDALTRVVEKNHEPPRKLAARILFSGCSMSTLEGLKKLRGNHPYEKHIGYERQLHRYAEQVLDSPTSLLPPKSSLIQNDNYETFLASQRLILIAVSDVCKYVQCSNVEITASHSFVMHSAPDSNDPPLLAMSCTATRTNKDSLAAISEVPVVTETANGITWYGQPHKKPTSEYKPHWLYHNRNQPARVCKNLIVHFHPIALLDAFRKVHERDEVKIDEREFIKKVSRFFRENDVDFHVYEVYEKHSSRTNEFGRFMRDSIDDNSEKLSVIWKPNHGIWVFLDDRKCSDGTLVETFLVMDSLSQDAVQSLTAQ